MYGLILENLSEYIRSTYGDDRWEEIRRQAAVEQPSFSVHQVYPENLIPRLAKKAIQVSRDLYGESFYGAVVYYREKGVVEGSVKEGTVSETGWIRYQLRIRFEKVALIDLFWLNLRSGIK